jgi:hypothetical protein
MATNVEQLILAIKSVGLKEAQKELTKLKNEAKSSGTAVDNLGKSTEKTGRVFKGFRGATSALTNTTGQLSVQVQDVAVQLESGTDAVRVFAQQGPQIAAIFGPSGAAFGALLAIGALIGGPFIRSLFAANEAIKETRERLNEFTEDYASLSEAQRRAKLALITEEMIELGKTITSLKDTQQDSLDRFNELSGKSGVDLITGLKEIVGGFTNLRDAQIDSAKELLISNAAVEEAENQYKRLQVVFEILTGQRKEETEEIKKANEALSEYIKRQEQIAAKKDVSAPMRLLIEATDMAAEAGRKLTQEEFNRIVAAGQRIQQIQEQKQAEKDANQLDILHKQQQAEREKELTQAIRQELKVRRLEEKRVNDRVTEMQRAEDDLRSKGLIDAEKDVYDSYNRRAEIIEQYRKDQLISEGRYIEAKANLEEEAATRAIQATGDALTAIGQFSKDAFYAAKAFSIAQAIINTYEGATKALAAYPPPFNFIAAAATVASGLAQVQQIRSQQPPSSARALGGQVRGGESYVVGERGPEVLTMGTNGRIIPNDKLGGSQQVVNRNINVSFQISTVDARGFDSLLQSRRGQIIGMINSAMNDRGTRGIV